MSAPFQSLEKLEKICSKNPTSILFARLAEGFLIQGNVKRAAEICRQGLRYRPSYVAGHVVMGKCHLAVEHFEEARQEFQKVLQLDADHPAALWHLGQIDLQLGWDDLALRHFELALILDPLNQELVAQIAELKGEAVVSEKTMALPGQEDVLTEKINVGEVEAPVADADVIQEEYEVVGEDETSDVDHDAPTPELVVDENLSSLVSELAQGDHTEREDVCEEQDKPLENEGVIATATLAELYAQQGLIEQAVTTLEQVLAREPANARIQARLDELRS